MKRRIAIKVVCMLLTSCMIVSYMFFHVSASNRGACGDDLTWVMDETTGALTIDGHGQMYNFEAGYKNSIECPWSQYRDSITTLIIHNGVTSVSAEAFCMCSKLSEVSLPDSLTMIGSSAFAQCSSLQHVMIPDGVIAIGPGAFSTCKQLKYIGIPGSVKEIGHSAFYKCRELESMAIPSGVVKIESSAFSSCSNLKTIWIPESVTEILRGAFWDCTSLTDIYYTGSEADWNSLSVSTGNESIETATVHYNYTGSVPLEPSLKSSSLENFTKAATYTQGQFIDVDPAKWYNESVAAAYEYGIFIGNDDGRFGIGDNLTIAQALAIADRLHNKYYGGPGQFAQGEPWYQVYIDYAEKYGIIRPDQYDPEAYATRAQYADILSAALPDEALQPINNVQALPDVKNTDACYSAVLRLYNAGILRGNDEYGTFTPDSTIVREEVAAMATRVVDIGLRQKYKLEEKPVDSAEKAKAAYAALLRERVGSAVPGIFALAYIDGDDIPELVFAYGPYHQTNALVYTYRNGSVVECGAVGGWSTGGFEYVEKGNSIYYLEYPVPAWLFQIPRFFQLNNGNVQLVNEIRVTNSTGVLSQNGNENSYTLNGTPISYAEYVSFMDREYYSKTWKDTRKASYTVTEENIRTILLK